MTDWQKLYEEKNTPWDRVAASPVLIDWLGSHRMPGAILVPGCGPGNDLLALATSGAEKVVGLDIAAGAIAVAAERTRGMDGVSLVTGDLFTLDHGRLRCRFDWVFEHTCFCAIDRSRREDYVRSVAGALRPGGHLLAVFYLEPWDQDEDQTQGPPFRSDLHELDALFGSEFDLLYSAIPTTSFPGRAGKELIRLLRRC